MNVLKANTESANERLEKIRRRLDTLEDALFDGRSARDIVDEIIARVKRNGDATLVELTKKLDGAALTPGTIRVTQDELDDAAEKVSKSFLATAARIAKNIEKFHLKRRRKEYELSKTPDVTLGVKRVPLMSAGIYIPAATAPLVSSVMMNVVPAKVAGVDRIAVATPPDRDGTVNRHILAVCGMLGVGEVYKLGGAQAVAALAYGTETVQKVDFIAGPGSVFVQIAKKAVYGQVGIDMIAGPSEILVLADGTADPRYIAADLLAQAEHDPLAAAMLFTDSEKVAAAVPGEIEAQLAKLKRAGIAKRSLDNYGAIVVFETMDDAIGAANEIASEHVEVQTADPEAVLAQLRSAGAVFLGGMTCEAVGDYYAGPSHTLPTGRTARFFSGLSTDTFTRSMSVLSYSEKALRRASKKIIAMGKVEKLDAHINSVRVRLNDE